MPDRPNLLLFFTDDQRFDTIRALGNDAIETPNLDALVERGTVFTHAHIPGGTCGAVCMPSRAMLHTGRTLFHLDGEGQEIPPDHTLLGESARAAGYTSIGIGKWHNGRAAYARSFSDGDEIFFKGMGDHWNVKAYHFDPSGRYDRRCPYVPDPSRSNRVHYRQCDHVTAGVHSTDLFTDAAIRCLERRDPEQPFFLYVSLMAPHDPRTMPERFRARFDPADMMLPPNFSPSHAIDTGALRVRDEELAAFPRDPDEIRRHIAEYYAMITHLDDAFGRLVRSLEEQGELDRTLIVFAGDNGLAVGQHGLMGKQNLYDHSLRVPLVFAGPGIPAGARCDALVYLLDIFPTLCPLMGMETPDSIEGRNLVPLLEHPGETVRDSLYLAYGDSIRGVTTGRRKLIEYACGATQYFDLESDPHEIHSLADHPERAAEVAALRKTLVGHALAWDDRAHPKGEAFWRARADLAG